MRIIYLIKIMKVNSLGAGEGGRVKVKEGCMLMGQR